MALSQATVTGILDRLEARGLVTRTRSASDRRRVLLALTAAGHTAAARAPAALHGPLMGRLAALPAEHQQRIHDALVAVATMMAPEPGGPGTSTAPPAPDPVAPGEDL